MRSVPDYSTAIYIGDMNSLPTNDGVCRHDAMSVKQPMTVYAVMKNDRALAAKQHARESPKRFDDVIMN